MSVLLEFQQVVKTEFRRANLVRFALKDRMQPPAHLTSDHTLAANAYNYYCRQDYYKYVPVDTTAITYLTYDPLGDYHYCRLIRCACV